MIHSIFQSIPHINAIMFTIILFIFIYSIPIIRIRIVIIRMLRLITNIVVFAVIIRILLLFIVSECSQNPPIVSTFQ